MTRQVFFAGFSLTLSAALAYYINSSFLDSIVGSKRAVGLVYALSATLAFMLILFVPTLGRRYGLLKPSRWFAIAFFAGLATLALSREPVFQIAAFIASYAAIICLGLWLDIYLETLSSDQHTGRIRGGYLTVLNTAILFAPYISGAVLNRGAESGPDYRTVYLLSCLAALPFLYQIFFKLPERSLPISASNLRQKLRDSNLRKILALDFLLNLFYFFMVIFLPLHLVQTIHLTWGNVGLIFTIMLLPFVLIEYALGWLADLRWGEKEILSIGLIVTAIFTVPIAFLTTANIAVWAILLFLTRIGASAVESMKETYLFKKVTGGDIGVISLSRLIIPSAYLIGSLTSVVFLRFFPISSLFLVIGVLFLPGLYFSLTLKDTK